MSVFDEIFYSDIDDTYDPYDDIANGRIPQCKMGKYINNCGYCCNKCFKEDKKAKEEARSKFGNYMFDAMFDEPLPETFNENFKFDPMLEYYKILKLIPPKTREEIRKAYLKQSLKCHPDKNNNSIVSVKQFQEINEAYKILMDKVA
tara:strand:+ start:2192 stop:2632 length:441 start_codon:yes stop_codon:yes gene_type:complete